MDWLWYIYVEKYRTYCISWTNRPNSQVIVNIYFAWLKPNFIYIYIFCIDIYVYTPEINCILVWFLRIRSSCILFRYIEHYYWIIIHNLWICLYRHFRFVSITFELKNRLGQVTTYISILNPFVTPAQFVNMIKLLLVGTDM